MKIAALALVAAMFAFGSAAHAGDLSGNVTIASDYINRGVSNAGHGVVQGEVDYNFKNNTYVGAWGSTVHSATNKADFEFDLYAGVKPTYKDFNFDFGAIYYGYPDQSTGSDLAYGELKAGVSHNLFDGTVGASVNYSPDFQGGLGKAFYYEVNASYPLTSKLSVSGALGQQALVNGGQYNTGNVGLTYALTKNLAVDLRYSDLNPHFEKSHTVLSLTRSF